MAVTLQELVVKIQGDVADLKAAMAEGQSIVKSSTEAMQDSVAKFSEESSGAMAFFRDAAATALGVFTAEGALEAIKSLGEAIIDNLVEAIREDISAAEEHEVAVTRMNIALANTGEYSIESSEGMQKFSEQMLETTGTTEDATLKAAAYIQMLTGLSGNATQDATHASIELAATLGIDVQSAAVMVTRAIDGNVTALARHGIVMEDTGTQAGNLAALIDALGNNMTNSERLTGTYSGALAMNAAQHHALSEAIGSVWVENQAVVDVINEITKLYAENTASIKANLQSYKELIAEGIMVLIASVESVIQAFDMLERVAEATMTGMMVPLKLLIAGIVGVQQALSGDVVGAMKTFGENGVSAFTDIGKAFTDKSKLGDLASLFDRIGIAAATGYNQLTSGAKAATMENGEHRDSIVKITKAMQDLIDEGQKLYNAELKKDESNKYAQELKSLEAYHKSAHGSDTEYYQALDQLSNDRTTAEEEANGKRLVDLQNQNDEMSKLDKAKYADQIAQNQAAIDLILDTDIVSQDKLLQYEKKTAADRTAIDQARTQAAMTALSNLATFQNAKNSEMAAIGKAAAISSTIISTYQGATSAFTALAGIPLVGPELGTIAAAAAIAAGLGRVAQIEGVQLATGLDTVPGVGFGDSFPAMLEPGEGVTDRGTNSDMKAFFSGGGSNAMTQGLQTIADKIDQLSKSIMSTPTKVIVGGKTISDTLRQEIRNGRNIYA